ncbi:hypothetical protein CPB86DRAFT_362485 [Serendipita vermifera]|nr:hypothetical protein CPB86DRAFT_362485 [Serendipita vermifera]
MFHLSNFPLLSLVLMLSLLPSLAPKVNAAQIMVDDTDPDIHYFSDFVLGPDCSSCWAKPDPAQAYKGTWHDAFRANPNMLPARMLNYTFHGTGIAIYAIVPHGDPYENWTAGNTGKGITWNIDGNVAYPWTPSREETTDPPTYTYGVMVGYLSGLPEQLHTLNLFINFNQATFLVRPLFTSSFPAILD